MIRHKTNLKTKNTKKRNIMTIIMIRMTATTVIATIMIIIT